MDALYSECSSGCESGWTLYFDHSSCEDAAAASQDLKRPEFGKKGFDDEEVEEEEEDLSMVSDASSGPPTHYEAVDAADESPWRSSSQSVYTNAKKRKTIKPGQGEDYQSLLEDTASSPAIVTNHRGGNWKGGVGIQKGGSRRRRSACQEQQRYDEFLHSPISGHTTNTEHHFHSGGSGRNGHEAKER